jgi:hypothetical protein
MAEKEMLLQQANEYDLTLEHLRTVRWQAETPTRVIARQLSHLEEQVLRVQTQLSLIDLELRRPRKQERADKNGYRARLNPWHPEFDIWSYVFLLSVFMLIAFAAQVMWA